jgi:hypothetical protein
VERNRLKEFLSQMDYQDFFGALEESQGKSRISSLWRDRPAEFFVAKPTRESDREIREAVKTAVEQFLKSLSRQVTESSIAKFQQKIVELENKLNRLNRLLLPFLEILEEEIQIEEKLQKEMPALKFEKQDPFALKQGGWALPYEQLRELLEEE